MIEELLEFIKPEYLAELNRVTKELETLEKENAALKKENARLQRELNARKQDTRSSLTALDVDA